MMAVQFNGASCCAPVNKKNHPQGAKFGQNYAQRAGAPGKVQFGIIDGGVVSGPCACIGCCCAPFLAIPAAILALVIGKKAFKGVGGLGRGLRGLGERAGNLVKRGAKETAETA